MYRQDRLGARASDRPRPRHHPKTKASSTRKVEAFLRDRLKDNEQRGIQGSENAVIERLLKSSAEMLPVYAEIIKKCHVTEWRHVVEQIVIVAAYWNPVRMKQIRRSKNRLKDLNKKIQEAAAKLAELLGEREQEAEQYSLDGYGDLHPIDWIIRAAEASDGRTSTLFKWYVKEKLELLIGQYDLKYWPSLADTLRAVASFANTHDVGALDPLTAGAISSRESSVRDFWRALSAGIELLKKGNLIPQKFKFSDKSLSEIANCALGIEADRLTDANQVKTWRHAR